MNAQRKRSDTLANPSRMPAGKLKLAVMWMAMFVISGLFVSGAIEISLRVIVDRALREAPPTRFPLILSSIPGLGYQLAPDKSTGDILTDSHGFRVRPADKEPVRHNILLVGDSISYGMKVAYEKTFAPLLEASLTQALGEHTAVWNAAVPGYNTHQELLQMERMAPIVNPELVIVQFCLNDYDVQLRLNPAGWLELDYEVQAPQAPSDAGFSAGSYLIGLARKSHALLFANQLRKEFQESHPEWFPRWAHYVHHIHTKPGWERAKAALLRMDEAAKKRNARLLIVVFPYEPQLRLPDREAQDDLVRFAQAHQLSMLDLYEVFRARWQEGLYIGKWGPTGPPDTMHLNERGHALASSEIARAILERSEYYLHKKHSSIANGGLH
jgi:lysophospholipase L1-like esterase